MKHQSSWGTPRTLVFFLSFPTEDLFRDGEGFWTDLPCIASVIAGHNQNAPGVDQTQTAVLSLPCPPTHALFHQLLAGTNSHSSSRVHVLRGAKKEVRVLPSVSLAEEPARAALFYT